MTRVRFFLLALVVVAALGTAVGLVLNARGKRVTAEDFLGAPRSYDTTGGQQMKPRW